VRGTRERRRSRSAGGRSLHFMGIGTEENFDAKSNRTRSKFSSVLTLLPRSIPSQNLLCDLVRADAVPQQGPEHVRIVQPFAITTLH
jgi:hypothetical protein